MIHGKGTYGWVKATTDEQRVSNSTVEGNTGHITSFRTEAQGLVNLLWSGGIDSSTWIYTDNNAVVKKVNEPYPLHPMQKEWELIEPARRKVQEEQLRVDHVQGHQEKKKQKLTWVEQLNIEVDKQAGQAHQDPRQTGYIPPGYAVLLYIDGMRITTNITSEIHRAATTPELRQYYIQKHRWTDSTLDQMDWNAMYQAVNSFVMTEQRTIHKYMHGWLPTGKQLHRRYKIANQCPHCKQEEDEQHMMKFPTRTAETETFKQCLNRKLKHLWMDEKLHGMLINYMFGKNEAMTYNDRWLEKIQTDQDQIGTGKIWKGYITQQWGDYQENSYQENGEEKQYTGTKWVKILITEVYKHMLDTWGRQNDKLHQNKKRENPHKEKLQEEIEQLYKKYQHTPEILTCLYKHSLQKLLKKSIGYLKKWKEIMEGMDQMAAVQEQRREDRDIRKYLPMQEKPPDI